MTKKVVLSSSTTHIPLMDTERDSFDFVCIVNLMEFRQTILVNQNEPVVSSRLVKSSLLSAIIPSTYLFPEFVTWLTSSLYLQRCYVMNSFRENIFQVTSLLIH